MKVMLHACCGPCLLEPFDALASEHEVRVAYANPNIHPRSEYEHRRDTLLAWTESQAVEVDELAYEPEVWDRAVAGLEEATGERCRACYRLRLGLVAKHAAESGFDAVATTLTVSPWQDPDGIREAGVEACAEHGRRLPGDGLPRPLRRGDAAQPRARDVPPELLRVPVLRC